MEENLAGPICAGSGAFAALVALFETIVLHDGDLSTERSKPDWKSLT